jgi:succinoglycan biosynthesis transport protein ExoP
MNQLPSDNDPRYLPPPPGYPLNPMAEEKEIHLRDYWRVIRKRKWMILVLILIAVVITSVKLFTTRSVYRGTATIQINIETAQIIDFKEIFTVNTWAMDFYQTQYKILESRNLARRVIRSLNLSEHPDFLPQPSSPFEQWRTNAKNAVVGFVKSLNILGSSHKPPPTHKDSSEIDKDAPFVNKFLGRLTIEPVKDSRIVKVNFTTYDPTLASQVPNALAASFVQLNLESRLNTSEQAKDWLSKQLDEMKAKVEKSDETLQEFGSKFGIISSLDDKENVTMRRLNELNESLTKAESERMAKEAIYKQITQDKGQVHDNLPSIMENKLIQDLKQSYIQLEAQYMKLSETFKPGYPEMTRLKSQMDSVEKRLNTEVKKMIGGMKTEYESALRREFLLRTAFEQQKGKALEMQQKSIQYNILKREADTNKELYKSLLQRMKEVGVSAGMNPSNIQILDRAETPTSPYNPYAERNLLIAALIGFSLGVALAFFFEYLDNTIKTPADVEQLVRLPSFGMVPEIANEKRKHSEKGNSYPVELVSYGHPKSILSEAYRNIRTSLLLSFSKQPPKKIVVTSPSPLEGKTTTMINTSISLSQTGARVLMIDADMRKPRVHKIFNNEMSDKNKNGVGLSNFLSGHTNLWSVIHKSSLQNLYYIPSGPIPPNPAELLGSSLFKEMMEALSEQFDHIVIDSPPVIGFADSVILASASDGVMLVVLCGKTSKEALQRAKEAIVQVEAKILGVVINRVDLRRSEYGYHYYRYYYYYGEDGKKKKKIPDLSKEKDISQEEAVQ